VIEKQGEEPKLLRLSHACALIDGMKPATARRLAGRDFPPLVRVGGMDFVSTSAFREWLDGKVRVGAMGAGARQENGQGI
jgi:hypothetical protein